MEATASAKYLRGWAQKARLVADMIRGKDVNQALAILRYSKKRAAVRIENGRRSEIANALNCPGCRWVKTTFVDRGPTKNRRRVRPAPQGRAYREQRHFCHITISLSNDAKPEPKGSKTAEPVAAKPAKLAPSKSRKRGGAAAAPRTKKAAPKADASEATEKPAAKKASKKKKSEE